MAASGISSKIGFGLHHTAGHHYRLKLTYLELFMPKSSCNSVIDPQLPPLTLSWKEIQESLKRPLGKELSADEMQSFIMQKFVRNILTSHDPKDAESPDFDERVACLTQQILKKRSLSGQKK